MKTYYEGNLSAFITNSSRQLNILWHNNDAFCMNSAQVSILKEINQISLRCFLQGPNRCALEAQIGFKVLGDLTHQVLEGQLSDQQLRRLLVSSNFFQSYSTGSVTMRLLDASSGRGTLTRHFGGELLPCHQWTFVPFAWYVS